MSIADEFPRPPAPPPLQRRLRFGSVQWIFIAVVVGVVALAAAGLAGERWRTVVATAPSFAAKVEYPARLRLSKRGTIRVRVRPNAGGAVSRPARAQATPVESDGRITVVPWTPPTRPPDEAEHIAD